MFVCLLLILILALAGPLHSHTDLSKADAGCTLCHAGDRTVATNGALDAGKPPEFVPAERVIAHNVPSPVALAPAVRSPRAPPALLALGRLG